MTGNKYAICINLHGAALTRQQDRRQYNTLVIAFGTDPGFRYSTFVCWFSVTLLRPNDCRDLVENKVHIVCLLQQASDVKVLKGATLPNLCLSRKLSFPGPVFPKVSTLRLALTFKKMSQESV